MDSACKCSLRFGAHRKVIVHMCVFATYGLCSRMNHAHAHMQNKDSRKAPVADEREELLKLLKALNSKPVVSDELEIPRAGREGAVGWVL